MGAQLDQFGREPQAGAHLGGIGRGPQLADRGASRLGDRMGSHQGEHLVEFERFEIPFPHRE